MSPRRRIVLAGVTLAGVLLLVEGLLNVIWLVRDYAAYREGLPATVQFKEESHARHDADIGWVHVPHKRIPDLYGPARNLTINGDGLRGLEDYVGRPPGDRLRIVFLGDSFTLGYGVDDRFTYPAQLEALNPGVQAVNMGQGGYSVGQCYLWYARDGRRLGADALVFAFLLDDVWRMAGTRTDNGYALPGFELDGGRVRVTGRPLPGKIETGQPLGLDRIGFLTRHSGLFRTAGALLGRRDVETRTGSGTELVTVALAVFDEVHRLTQEDGIPLVLVLFPAFNELTDPVKRNDYRHFAGLVGRFAAERGIPFLDLSARFFEEDPRIARTYFLDEVWHHYSDAGQGIVAQELERQLRHVLPGYPGGSGPPSQGQ